MVQEFDALLPEGRFSAREAFELSGVPHSTVALLRRALATGADLPDLQQKTRRQISEFIERNRKESSNVSRETSGGGNVERAVALLAAERLEQMAAQLRSEAIGSAPPREVTTQVKRVGRAVKEARTPAPKKQAGRKGE
jgi:hypothetical protein